MPSADGKNLTPLRFALKAAGVREFPDSKRTGIHSRGYLPHVKREGSTYFVTFRLADALPKAVIQKFQAELKAANPDTDLRLEMRRKIERFLDAGAGACLLKRNEMAELVAQTLSFWDNERYLLADWVVMPNHVHAIVQPLGEWTLSNILQSWKSYTARKANLLLERSGVFWQRESYDHWIRSDEEKAKIAAYIRRNPVKAKLCMEEYEWKYSSAWTGQRDSGE